MLFLPVRRLAGPLHRRHRTVDDDQNDELPPLGVPWQDPRWFRGDFPPHHYNDVQPLIDGNQYFSDLYAALQTARERVTIAGWCLTPMMPLCRQGEEHGTLLVEVLAEVSQRAEVLILLWRGAPALFAPTQHMTKEIRETFKRMAPRVRCELDDTAPFSHDHHQKAVTIDGRLAYVGGMDLSTFQGDRWDTSGHPLRFGPNWHDVQLRLQGEVVSDVEQNFCQRWNAVTGESLAPLPPAVPDPAWKTAAQVVRTIPAGFYPFAPDGIYGIHHALVAAIRQAKQFIYLENQYLWAPEIVDALIEAMKAPGADRLRIVVVLPAKALDGKYDNDEHVRLLTQTDDGRGIFHAYTLYTGGPAEGNTGHRHLPIYVHAKVAIVDDEWFSVGSANLNRRGIATDAEMNVHAIAPDVARSLRIRLWAEHLGVTVEEVAAADPIDLIDQRWHNAAQTVHERIRTGAPPVPAAVCPYVPDSHPVSRFLDVLQGMTLEH